MKTVLIIILVFGVASAAMGLCACMLSSDISQREERLEVRNDDDTR